MCVGLLQSVGGVGRDEGVGMWVVNEKGVCTLFIGLSVAKKKYEKNLRSSSLSFCRLVTRYEIPKFVLFFIQKNTTREDSFS